MKKSLILVFVFMQGLLLSHVYAESKPLIGITPSFSNNSIQLNNDYVAAINENGGIAIILPPTASDDIVAAYVNMLDGAVFSGGPDIPPEFYGQALHQTTKVMEPVRFEFEKRFIKSFLDSGKPVLGICLGMQFSNVVASGTMLQDLPELVGEKVCHRNGEMYTNLHLVGISKGSRLGSILDKAAVSVISRHHQAVDVVGDLFSVVARSTDGVVEALERKTGSFGLFVQWHPESMKDVNPEHRNRLFSALIEACKNLEAAQRKN